MKLDDAGQITAYRFVQEAFTNIAKYARASRVSVILGEDGTADGQVRLTVSDNGVGFGEASMFREGSHGLLGMRERALMLGGELEIGDAPGGGGRVTVRLPLLAPAQADAPLSEAPAPARRPRRAKGKP